MLVGWKGGSGEVTGHLLLVPGAALSCATLRWLLAENTAAEALSSQDVAEVRGLAPDGGEVQLLIREARNGLALRG